MAKGDDEIRNRALEMVLRKVVDDPHHDSIPSVNYFNENNSSSVNFNESQLFPDRKYSSKNRFILFTFFFKIIQGNRNIKTNGLMSMNSSSSSNLSIQLSGLQRLSQLILNAGGTTHLTMDSLFVRKKISSLKSIVEYILALFIIRWLS